MSSIEKLFTVVFTGILGLAILSVLLSKNAQTTSVLGSLFSGLSGLIGTATGPITGNYTASAGATNLGSTSSVTGGLSSASGILNGIGTIGGSSGSSGFGISNIGNIDTSFLGGGGGGGGGLNLDSTDNLISGLSNF